MTTPQRTLAILAATALGLAPQLHAQDDASPKINANCEADEHRQFDFWLGSWTVEGADGNTAGTNSISRISDGCALLERWTSAQGGTGTSINMYEPRGGHWTQVWVSPGAILRLSGGLEGGSMVLSGDRVNAQGQEVIDRITWTPNSNGSVRQHWEVSGDGGESWQTLFDGRYEKAGG